MTTDPIVYHTTQPVWLQKRCRHGWLNGTQCETCAELAAAAKEIERLTARVEQLEEAAEDSRYNRNASDE